MSKPAGTELPERAVAWLVGGNPVVIATVDAKCEPYTGIVGSCIAIDARTLRFAAFSSGRTVANLRQSDRVFVETLGDDLVLGIGGRARIIREPMRSSAFPPHHYVMVEITVESVKDDLPPGSDVHGMSYGFARSRDPEERLRRRAALVEEMRAWQPADKGEHPS